MQCKLKICRRQRWSLRSLKFDHEFFAEGDGTPSVSSVGVTRKAERGSQGRKVYSKDGCDASKKQVKNKTPRYECIAGGDTVYVTAGLPGYVLEVICSDRPYKPFWNLSRNCSVYRVQEL